MISPRWRKVLKDLTGNKVRTLLVIFTIAVGVFAVGFVGDMFFTTLPDLDRNYQRADSHGARLFTELFTEDLYSSLEKVDGVDKVEGRSVAGIRVLTPSGAWLPMSVSSIPDLEKIKIDKLFPAIPNGTIAPLDSKQIYIERTARSMLQINPGGTITVELPNGQQRRVQVADYVFDVNAIPYAFSQSLSGYASPETIVWLGGVTEFSQLYIAVKEKKTDQQHVQAVAEAVADKFKDSGREVYFTFVYLPGRHFAADITRALGLMMMFLGFLSVGVSAFLIINTVNALLNQQIRQIGVMKSVGARTSQLVGMYLALTSFFGLLALLIAVPLSLLLSGATNGGITTYLNFDPSPFRIAPQGIFLQAFVALVIPVLAALLPVLKGSRITVREAITSYGLGRGVYGQSRLDRFVDRLRSFPRPLLISLRNTFRRKARLFLTLSALVLAGGIFIGVTSLRGAMNSAMEDTFGYILSDVNVSFARDYQLKKVLPMAMSVPGVVHAESWGYASGSVLLPDQSSGTEIDILAVPSNSDLIDATLTSGRWLLPEDQNAVVIGNALLAARPELKVGDEIQIDIDGTVRPWRIVGVYRFVGTTIPPLLYANLEYLSKITHTLTSTWTLRVVTSEHSPAFQKQVASQIDTMYKAAGVDVNQVLVGSDLIRSQTSNLDVLVYFLLVMSVLIAVVGGLGMTSTMSINVFERTRELGVMRAIGASNRSMFLMVIVEGMLIGMLSWLFGVLVSVPIAMILNYAVGISILQSPLDYVFSWDGFILWLIMILVISILASAIPARSAMRLTVREVLAYE